MNRIKILQELVINQIAAGEVVERPASVIKELIENSIDANSTVIRIYLEQGGIASIKVIDNGTGIHPDDLPLVFLQHATSKIIATSDLNNINSLGFRGEALASISSVAKTNIISKQSVPHGTTIEVKDLFYNTPARRKFLRSSRTEFNYVLEIFKRIALSEFSIEFILYHNNKLIKNLPSCAEKQKTQDFKNFKTNQEKRLIKVCGKTFAANATFFDVSQNGLQLFGWLSKIENIAGSNIQYLYINNRVVKDKLFSVAVKQAALKAKLPQAYCLYLMLDPTLVDINVHPTKQEVRFRDPRIIYSFVYENVLEVLTGMVKNYTKENNKDINLHKNVVFLDNLPYLNGDLHDKSVEMKNTDLKLLSIFNNKYVIFERPPSEIVFLEVAVGLKWLIEQRLQYDPDLASYNLVIPERIKLEKITIDRKKINLDLYINFLRKFKFFIDQIHEDVLLIRAIPNCLNLLQTELNYQDFMLEFLQINHVLLKDLENSENLNNLETIIFTIKLITKHLNSSKYILHSKSDLIFLIEALTKENFCFSVLDEQQFSKLTKFFTNNI